MIRIERGAEVDGPVGDKIRHGIWEYSCPVGALRPDGTHSPGYPLVRGHSRQPLLDACRQLKSLYGVTRLRAGLFRKGVEVADISCQIETGAATTVSERDKGIVMFERYVDLAKLFRVTGATLTEPSS